MGNSIFTTIICLSTQLKYLVGMKWRRVLILIRIQFPIIVHTIQVTAVVLETQVSLSFPLVDVLRVKKVIWVTRAHSPSRPTMNYMSLGTSPHGPLGTSVYHYHHHPHLSGPPGPHPHHHPTFNLPTTPPTLVSLSAAPPNCNSGSGRSLTNLTRSSYQIEDLSVPSFLDPIHHFPSAFVSHHHHNHHSLAVSKGSGTFEFFLFDFFPPNSDYI